MNVGAGQACVWVCTDARACRSGESPLWIASAAGHVLCVEALILAKADVGGIDTGPPPSGAPWACSLLHG